MRMAIIVVSRAEKMPIRHSSACSYAVFVRGDCGGDAPAPRMDARRRSEESSSCSWTETARVQHLRRHERRIVFALFTSIAIIALVLWAVSPH